MDHDRLEKQLAFFMECDKMKSIYRNTMLANQSRMETDAEHSWHIALMAMLLQEYAPAGINCDHTIRMCLVHDLVEIDAGDTFAYDTEGYKDKAEREVKAADRLFSLLPADQCKEFRTLWEEFEACQTPDALFANCCDRFQPVLNNIATNGHSWAQHHIRREQVEKRLSPIQQAMPQLWPYCTKLLDTAVEKGWLTAE
ncbi:MAG: HD domain-containing protein [Oscillospiraceae bacterium]|jgi:putative hydrolase of HD superfamily|nr:HD domain-containing protein [Oscillospiraceae bacterium]